MADTPASNVPTTDSVLAPTTTPTTETPLADTSVLGAAPAPEAPAAEPFDAEKLTLPEGWEGGDKFDAFKSVMKEFGVSQTRAQDLINFHAESVNAAIQGITDDWTKQQADWRTEVESDPEIGGSNFEVMKQTVAKVLDDPALTDPKFREAITFTGVGNHPAMVRTMYRWAKALTEGGAIAGSPAPRGRDGSTALAPTLADAIYGPTGPHTGGPKI